jgi:hypothetical protein
LTERRGFKSLIHSDDQVSTHFVVTDVTRTIEAEFFSHESLIQAIHREVLESLATSVSGRAFSVFFEFPEEVRVPCEQYLLYFGQFLSDLGVTADTDLVHKAGKVLFTVNPVDRHVALEKIREALDVYVKLPSAHLLDIAREPAEILNLKSEIHQLHAKLSLAAATLEAKDATIEAKQQTIEVLKLLKTGEVISASVNMHQPPLTSKDTARNDELEPVIGKYVGHLYRKIWL